MNISKSVGIVTTAIPIVGILIGGITFGVNFKTDVETIKEDIVNQKAINETIPDPYDDELIWLSIDNINIPDSYDDSNISKRIQLLEIDLAELKVLIESIDIVEDFDDSELRGRLAELEGSLQAVSNIEVDDNGAIDIAPLIVRIASLEGSMETVRTDIRSMKTDIKDNERAASSASNSNSSRTVERYDDSDLRSRISDVERRVNAIPTTTSSGATVQRVENPFDDSSLRSDISALQTAVAVLQAMPSSSYDDSELQDRIDDIQWQLENMDIQVVANDTTDTAWLETLIFDIKNELTWRIDELEWASDSTTASEDMYAEHWVVEDLQYEVMFIQEQVWELQELAKEYQNSANNSSNSTNSPPSSTVGRSWEGSWNEPYGIHLNHTDGNTNHTYTGDFWLDGYWNGEPVWTRWGCGVPPWDTCYIYKYNYTSWVLQPSEPGDEWLANSYNDNGEWPWEGTWSGDVNFVDVINN